MTAKSKKTITEEKLYCIGCRKKLERINLGGMGMDVMAIFAPSTYYCKNKKCGKFGLITVGVIKK